MPSLRDWNLLVTTLCYFPVCNSHPRTYALGKIAVPFGFALPKPQSGRRSSVLLLPTAQDEFAFLGQKAEGKLENLFCKGQAENKFLLLFPSPDPLAAGTEKNPSPAFWIRRA